MTTARHTCSSPDWYTPAELVDAAAEAMGRIDLDPASDKTANRTHLIKRIYTADNDGLVQQWEGCVFLNPPGGRVNAFWRKLCEEFEAGRVDRAVWIGYSLEQLQTLQNAGAKWHPLDWPMCIPRARIPFIENEAKRAIRLANIGKENRKRQAAGERLRRRNERADAPSHANYITYLGVKPSHFVRAFRQFGIVRCG